MDAQENHRHHDDDGDWGSHEGGHGSHEGGDSNCDWSHEGGRYDAHRDSAEHDDHVKAAVAKVAMFFFVLAIIVAVIVTILCCLKKKNRRAMSVADMHVIVKAPQPKPAVAEPLPKKSQFEVITITPPGAERVAPAAPPPEYRSTVDLRQNEENPRDTVGIMSPPPAYTESTVAPY